MRIETERLILRPLTIQDVDALVELHRQPAVIEFLGPATPESARERLEVCERMWQERGHDLMAVLERPGERFVGRIGLRYWPQWGETEAGWAISREVWGRGYATEAARAAIEWGFATLPLPYITAMVRPDNSRSLAVARRLGMTAIRDDVLRGVPVIVHAIDRENWGATPRSDEFELLLARVEGWARCREDVVAVAVVGSAGASEAELLVLSRDPAAFPDAEAWAGELGGAAVLASARRGALIEHRLRTASGLELRMMLGSVPRAGAELRALYDPEGVLAPLTESVA